MIHPAELVSAAALSRYDHNGDPVYTTAERIVLALRWFSWVSASGIRDALGLDDADEVDRMRYVVAMGRLVKRGIVEQRGNGLRGNGDTIREYRLVVGHRALPLRDTPAMARWRR